MWNRTVDFPPADHERRSPAGTHLHRPPAHVLWSYPTHILHRQSTPTERNTMAFKQFLVASAIALACLVANAAAFVAPMTTLGAPATASARSTASARGGALMSCRVNAKKEKRTRNRLNMRKFNKRGTSRKKILRVERQERAAEDEANFLAKVFHSGMDDWEEVDIFNE